MAAPPSALVLAAALCAFLARPEPMQAADLSASIEAILPRVSEAYEYLHRNPELGKKEFKAHDFLKSKLTAIGYTEFVASTKAPTAVIAVLDSGRPGPVIALRAEMDARPIGTNVSEPSTHDPRSEITGVMHNCGHDVHTAILLGAAELLRQNRRNIAGKVVFLFQPAEETAGGADDIVGEGILPRLGVEKIFAQHVAPGMPVGTIAISAGASLAGSSYFTVKLKGRESHAASPQDGDDMPLFAAGVARDLADFPARRLDIANRPVVISVAKLHSASEALNMIPGDAEISGTIRAFEDPQAPATSGKSIEAMLVELLDGLTAARGIKYEWSLRLGSPPTVNNAALFDEAVRGLTGSWPGTLKTTPSRGMFSEDFAFYTRYHHALYFSLGIAQDGLGEVGVHKTDFTVHRDALRNGLTLMTLLAMIGTTGSAAWQ